MGEGVRRCSTAFEERERENIYIENIYIYRERELLTSGGSGAHWSKMYGINPASSSERSAPSHSPAARTPGSVTSRTGAPEAEEDELLLMPSSE